MLTQRFLGRTLKIGVFLVWINLLLGQNHAATIPWFGMVGAWGLYNLGAASVSSGQAEYVYGYRKAFLRGIRNIYWRAFGVLYVDVITSHFPGHVEFYPVHLAAIVAWWCLDSFEPVGLKPAGEGGLPTASSLQA